MPPLPHLGPISALHEKLNRWHDPLRVHLSWMSTLTGLATLLALATDFVVMGGTSRWWAAGFAALTIMPNALFWFLYSRFPRVEPLNMRGLTMMNKWLEKRPDLAPCVARWLEACGDLDTRHFQCIRQVIEGNRRLPGPVGGQWLIRELDNGTLCRNAHDMLNGKMREQVMLVRKQSGYRLIDANTTPVNRAASPRRL